MKKKFSKKKLREKKISEKKIAFSSGVSRDVCFKVVVNLGVGVSMGWDFLKVYTFLFMRAKFYWYGLTIFYGMNSTF